MVGVSGVVVVTVATTSFGRVMKGIPLPNMQDNPVTEFWSQMQIKYGAL